MSTEFQVCANLKIKYLLLAASYQATRNSRVKNSTWGQESSRDCVLEAAELHH